MTTKIRTRPSAGTSTTEPTANPRRTRVARGTVTPMPTQVRRTPPSLDTIPLTVDGRRQLTQRLAHLQKVVLPEMRPLLTARERDERDVAMFERTFAEAQWLEAVLGAATPVPEQDFEHVSIGSRVQLAMPDGEAIWVRPVHPIEAVLDDERVSVLSPVSQAILGRAVGEHCEVDGPAGRWTCEILAIYDDAVLPAA